MLPQFFPALNNGITGEIRAFVGNLPHGWLECNGATFDGNTYPRLKTVLGGTTLPDLRNAALRGAGSSYPLNSKSGSNTRTIPIPAHTHTVSVNVVSTSGGTGDKITTSFLDGDIDVFNNAFAYKSMLKTLNSTSGSTGVEDATIDVRGVSYYVKFAICAL